MNPPDPKLALLAQQRATGCDATFRAACSCNPRDELHPGRPEVIQGRTGFQMNELRRIANEPGFIHFCGNPSYDGINDAGRRQPYTGPVTVCWYVREGTKSVMHAARIGGQRYLTEPYRVSGDSKAVR